MEEDGDGGGDAAVLDLLVQSMDSRARANERLAALQSQVVPLKLFTLGISTTAPNAEVSAAMLGAAAALEKLDNVALECRALGGSLSSLSVQAEAAVRRVRDIDAQRARLQAVLERVDDILDLRGCLSGVQAAMDAGDWDQAALHVNRFRSLERTLPIPAPDVAVMRTAEEALVATVTAQFDAAVAAASAAVLGGRGGSGESPPPPQATAASHAVIARCCQLLTLLGRADAGLQRYAAFLRESLSAECANEMRAAAAAARSIDEPGVGLSVLSAVLARAVAALDHAAPLVASLFAVDERGPAAVLAGVHAVCDHEAARVVLSLLRSGRVHAALLARDALVTLSGDRAVARRAAQRQLDLSASSVASPPPVLLSPQDAARVLAQIDDAACRTPFALLPLPALTSHIYCGRDFSDASTFDALVDELALVLQRCASYLRLVGGRAAAVTAQQRLRRQQQLAATAASDGAADAKPPAATAAQPDTQPSSAEAAVRSHAELLEASLELGGVYSALEHAKLHGGVAKAICIDELVEEGAAGAGLDIMSPLSLDPPPPRGGGGGGSDALAAAAAATAGGGGLALGEHGDELADAAQSDSAAGAGAMVSTVVEDAFYVCTLAGRRAFATGNADCAAGVVNHIVTAVSDRLLPELEARLRLAFDDGPSGGGSGGGGGGPGAGAGGASSGGGLSQVQVERIASLRVALMSSTPVKLAAAKLSAYQAVSTTPPVRLGSPLPAGLSARGAAGRYDGGGGNTPTAGNAGGRSAAPIARLTEEVAASALALNNLQLAIACVAQLQRSMQRDLSDYFSVAASRDAEKVGNCVSGLGDVSVTLRRALDTGLTTLSARLTPRLRSALNAFEGASSLIQYELSEEAFALASSPDGNNAFMTEFLPVLASILAPFQYALTPALANAVLTKVATYVAKQLEPRIRRKRINQLGGIQFDSDMRTLATFFAARCGRRVRSRFVRLLQMAQVLTLEAPAEILEYWGPNAGIIPWELSAEEVRSTLGLRVDFSPQDIARLRL